MRGDHGSLSPFRSPPPIFVRLRVRRDYYNIADDIDVAYVVELGQYETPNMTSGEYCIDNPGFVNPTVMYVL